LTPIDNYLGSFEIWLRGESKVRKGPLLASLTALAVWPSQAFAQDSYADPAGSGPIVNAITWLQGTLLGTVATVAAIIAVAAVGFLMLTGRMNWRYGATVILGCFVLFGAASIVGGIRSSASAGAEY
jgi:type IV secretion system protein VirB2